MLSLATLSVLTALLGAAIALGLTVFAWRRREVPGMGALLLLGLAVAEWAIVDALDTFAPTLELKYLFTKLQYVGIGLVPIGWLALALHYRGRAHWLTRWRRLLLCVEPCLTLALVRALGCRLGQGFLLARPMPAEEIDALLRQPSSRAA
jgi:hypothetical protein